MYSFFVRVREREEVRKCLEQVVAAGMLLGDGLEVSSDRPQAQRAERSMLRSWLYGSWQ